MEDSSSSTSSSTQEKDKKKKINNKIKKIEKKLEDSSSSTSSSTQEKTQETPTAHHPRYFLEPLSAILKCLGFQIITNHEKSSSNSDQKVHETTPQVADPQNADPQADPPLGGNPAVSLAAPKRPGIGSGSGGQIN